MQAGAYLMTLAVNGDPDGATWTEPRSLDAAVAAEQLSGLPPLPAAIQVLPGAPNASQSSASIPAGQRTAGVRCLGSAAS